MENQFSRRRFLLSSGKGLAGIASVSLLPSLALAAEKVIPQPPLPVGGPARPPEKIPQTEGSAEKKGKFWPGLPASERLGFAVVGLGKLTLTEILPSLAQSRFVKVTGLVSGDAKKAGRVAEQYGVSAKGIYSYQNFDEIAQNPEVKVVYIVLPNSMHKEYVLRAAKAGKHILCEKPMAMNAGEAEEMVAACKKAGVKLMIAYRQQYEPNNRMIREMIEEKSFGRAKLFTGTITQNQGHEKQWRHVKALAGGGALPDIGLYCINGVRYLSGEEPTEVFASSYSTPGDDRFREVEESINWQMRFPSGLLANCQASYSAYTDKFFRFSAEEGWYGMDPAYVYLGNKLQVSSADGSMEKKQLPQVAEVNQFAAEMDHFADCVMHDKEPQSPGEEGVQDHRIMDAIYESARTGKPVALKKYEGRDVFRHPQSLV